MKAADAQCPECGAGFADVATGYDIGPQHMVGYQLLPCSNGAIDGHCTSGHRFFAVWQADADGSVRHWTEAPFRIESERERAAGDLPLGERPRPWVKP